MQRGLQVVTNTREEADCISGALAPYDASVQPEGGLWLVSVSDAPATPDVTALLDALQACLEQNRIPTVRVVLDERSYVMEGIA